MRVLVYDGNWIAFKSFVTRSLCTYDGRDTTVAYGLFQDMRACYEKLQCDSVVVCWDSRDGSEKRREIYPEYKAQRREKKDEIDWKRYFESIHNARKLLKALNIHSFSLKRNEGDDIIAAVCGELERNGHEAIIRGSDKDFIQLLSKKVKISKDGETVIGDEFFKQNGITKNLWILERALIGDTSDNIDGIKGLGPVRARKISERLIGEKNLITFLKENDFSGEPLEKFYIIIQKELKKVRRNIKLMKLDKKFEHSTIRKIVLNIDGILDLTYKQVLKEYRTYEFNSLEKGLVKQKDVRTLYDLFGG